MEAAETRTAQLVTHHRWALPLPVMARAIGSACPGIGGGLAARVDRLKGFRYSRLSWREPAGTVAASFPNGDSVSE
jgi:hypothetical protein